VRERSTRAATGCAGSQVSAGRGNHLDVAAECEREHFGLLKRGAGVGRAVEPDDDLARLPGAVLGWTRQQGGTGRVVHEFCSGVAEHDSEKAAAPSAAERHERGVQLVAFPPEHVYRLAVHDARLTTRPAGDHRFGRVAGFSGLVHQQLREMRGPESGAERWGGVEGGNGAEDGILLRRQQECLAERLEPPVRPVHPYQDAREHAHRGHLNGR